VKKTMGRILSLLLLLGLVGGGYAAYSTLNSRTESAVSVLTTTVRRGDLAVSIPTIGILQARSSVVLSAPFEGRIIGLVEEGTRVAEGDPVVWFETREFEDQLEEQQAQLALDERDLQAAYDALELEKLKNEYTLESEKTRVQIARRDFEDAKQKFEAEQILFQRNISPQTQLEAARLRLLQSELSLRNAQINLAKVEENLDSNIRIKEREIDKARLRVEETQRRVREAEERIESAIVRAPSPGEVSYARIYRSGTVGKVTEGDQVSRRTNLIELPDTSVMLAVVPINEIDISRVVVGQRAEVMLEAIPGQFFEGVVEGKSIVPITDATRRTWDAGSTGNAPREFEVQIRLLNVDPLFRQGMTASARIYTNELKDVLQVPIEALALHEGRRGVWVQDSIAQRFVSVDVLASNENYAAIEGDVAEGTVVALNTRATRQGPEIGIEESETTREAAPALQLQQGGAASAGRPGGSSS
jgi:HlyD family secretion protein